MIFKSKTMDLNVKDAMCYLTFKSFDEYDFFNHAFSTRMGGVSKDEFTSMNLSFSSIDDRQSVEQNYKLFCNAADFDYQSIVASSQSHGSNVRKVTKEDKGRGITRPQDVFDIDGLLTNEAGVTLATYYADCTPLFFADPEKRVVGLAHAGWRGTVLKIGGKMIETMINDYSCKKEDIICAIGPAIGPCCFEVDYPVYRKFADLKNLDKNKFITEAENDKYYINLPEANKQILIEHGVLEKNITVSDLCTSCNSDMLFSHRKTNGKRGSMAAMICLI